MRVHARLVSCGLGAITILAIGCGDGTPADPGLDVGSPDASAPDAFSPEDAGPDALALSNHDAGLDAGATRDAGSDAGPRAWPLVQVPAITTPEAGIEREVLTVAGFDAPPNPVSGADTPGELDRTQIVRFRSAGVTDVRAIVIAMPGFLGGAGSFEMLARHLVRRAAAAGEPIEVWAIDRRSNLLEDLRGADTAEAMSDPDIARGYYFGSDTVGGSRFDGFVEPADIPYASEWGVATHVEDVRAIIANVPAMERRGRVFLMGHSLGATFTETYAAWSFEDGTRGVEELAGLVLIDGGQGETPLSEMQYLSGTSAVGFPSPGVNGIRGGAPFAPLPLLGVSVYARAEIAALETLLRPDELATDPGLRMVLATLFFVSASSLPAMTNEAGFGLAFDDASNGLSFAAVSMGQATGGAFEPFTFPLGNAMLMRPSDRTATYTWIDALDADPPEHTPVENLIHSWIDGRTNFAEWYFPTRLSLDLSASAGLALDPMSAWQNAYGIRAYDGALMDAPVLAIASGLRSVASYEGSRMRGAPLGAGRPNAGATRDDPRAYEILDATDMTHIDPLSGADTDRNRVPEEVLELVLTNAAPGRMAVPTLQ